MKQYESHELYELWRGIDDVDKKFMVFTQMVRPSESPYFGRCGWPVDLAGGGQRPSLCALRILQKAGFVCDRSTSLTLFLVRQGT